MGNTCKLLSKVFGVLGAIGTIVVAYFGGRTANLYSMRYDYYERNWPLTIGIFIGTGLGVAIISVALYTLGEIYDKVYSMSFNGVGSISESTAKGLEYLGQQAEEERLLKNGGWKCPNCGKINNSYETTCKCGTPYVRNGK